MGIFCVVVQAGRRRFMQKEISANNQNELYNCTFVKTILMILIVLYHSVLFWRSNWFIGKPIYEAQVLAVISRWLNSFHVYAFTLVSGYIFYYMKFEKGKYDDFRTFFINKCKRLLVPYMFCACIWVIPFDIYYFKINLEDIVYRYIFGTGPSQLWFLLMLFGVFILFYFFSGYIKKYTFYSGCIMIVFYAIGVIGQSLLDNYFQVWNICCFSLTFWLGFKIRQYGSSELFRIPSIVWLFIDVILFLCIQQLEYFDSIFVKLARIGISFILSNFGALMAFVILQRIAQKLCDLGKRRCFLLLAKNSMTIFLFHQQLVYLSISVLNGIINPYIHAIINFLFALTVSVLIAQILIRFRCTRFLLGSKM